MKLKNKIAIVTGASRGIGKCIAEKLSEEGANVVINFLHSEKDAELLYKKISKTGQKHLLIRSDVSKYDDVANMVDLTIKEFGRIDLLVNNAGITEDALILRMKEDTWDKVININLKGTFNCCKATLKYMIKQREGKIINITSIAGITGNQGQVNYASAKAGIIGLTKTLAKEYAERNILINAIAPGFIETEMTDKLSDKVKEEILKKIPLKRFGKLEDVAEVVLFLASDANYITGQVIIIDGGMVI